MTFVLREVLRLRGLGLRVETASINKPDRPPDRPVNALTPVEADEAQNTYYV